MTIQVSKAAAYVVLRPKAGLNTTRINAYTAHGGEDGIACMGIHACAVLKPGAGQTITWISSNAIIVASP